MYAHPTDKLRSQGYFDSRNIRDHQLNHELASIRTFIHETRVEILAYIRNQKLGNPTLPIELIVSLRDEGPVLPDETHFPKHAEQFYTLRHPITYQRVRMLSCLVDFYDVQYQNWQVSGDDADHCETYTDEAEGGAY
ncbi:hypothetical protein CORC01_00082 [Colletotrichum orchidophilum]|uniref:Uncharacterized protein n=1 Tax=Colletotrichum orchidophilum TaxID=1209926 RepID=A0A1G4BT94_9PEZI|nr:uncharacterized protein CORC01_00082 [Colletotrichum orchidophilum]OHF04611.1 hypothetical protein CORC01_00082 [Colletotrichum orchidophilum]